MILFLVLIGVLWMCFHYDAAAMDEEMQVASRQRLNAYEKFLRRGSSYNPYAPK